MYPANWLLLYELDHREPCAAVDNEGRVRLLPTGHVFVRAEMPKALPEILFAAVPGQLILKASLHIGPLSAASELTGPVGVETPALDVLLGRSGLLELLDVDGTPNECVTIGARCPFADGDVENEGDPGEGTFDCLLLDREVWGESPPCSRAAWQAKARQEFAALLGDGG